VLEQDALAVPGHACGLAGRFTRRRRSATALERHPDDRLAGRCRRVTGDTGERGALAGAEAVLRFEDEPEPGEYDHVPVVA
jgi:hypothetical protein